MDKRTERTNKASAYPVASGASCVVIALFRSLACLPSDEFDLGHQIIFVARGHGDFDLVVDTAADQRAAERRIIADLAILRVGFGLADDLVTDGLVVLVGERDGRAEHAAVARQRRRIEHLRARKLFLPCADRLLHLAL